MKSKKQCPNCLGSGKARTAYQEEYDCPCTKTPEAERERSVGLVMDLYYALKHIGGTPTLKDLVKLAQRIKKD